MKTVQTSIFLGLVVLLLAVVPAAAKTVTLSWDPSPTDTVTGYEILYAAGSTATPSGGTGASEGNSPVDAGDVLSFTLTGLADDQVHSFAVVAYDADGNKSTLSNVVESPVIEAPPVEVPPGGDKEVILSWDPSPTSTVVGYRIVYELGSTSTPSNGTGANEGDSPIDVGNVLTYTLTGLQEDQTYSFAVIAYDAAGNSSTYSNVVESTAASVANNPPVLAAIGSKSILESASLSFTLSATDADGDQLSYSAANLPSGASFDTATGNFSWTPGYDQSGSYTVTFTVSDGSDTDSEAVLIAVNNVNRAPTLVAIGAKSVAENTTLSFAINGIDPDNDSLSYSAANLPSGASFDTATGNFSWTPGYDQSGSYAVTFTASDGSASDSETVTLTVSNVNRAPVLSGIGTQTVAEGTLLNLTLRATDPDGDSLSYSAETLPDGATFNAASQQFSWTVPFAATENIRIYSVTFSVTDGELSDTETVSINVTNVNQAPVLEPIGDRSLSEGEALNLVVSATDPDGTALLYSADNVPEGAVFTPSTRSLSWIPAADQAGSYQVTFSVSDGTLSASETVTLTVINSNQPPVLDAIGNQSISEGAGLVLTISASDAENDALAFSATGLPQGASFDPDQARFSWTPDFSQSGNYSVTFNVSDGSLTDSETVAISVANTSQPPTISGSPATSVMATSGYSFTPTATDPDGDRLTFSISNKPVWASFDSLTGQLSGTPSEQQVGISSGIEIGVSDGSATVLLAPFSIEVQAFVAVDSDGDGVLDHEDAFPDDPNEWLDTDGDLIGNNADSDDDNDGVADAMDGAPQDANTAAWLITATAASGGYITPEGTTPVAYGASQAYSLTPMAGYYVSGLLVDNVSVGIMNHYQFDDVAQHHNIEALFAPIPTGLSLDPTAAGLAGVDRVDGGADSDNLVEGVPKLDLEYQFSVTMRDTVTADQRRVYLVLDGYRYPMQLASGAISNGASYQYTTRLGPAYAHSFYYLLEDAAGNLLARYPQSGGLSGPVIELLEGRNLVGAPADIESLSLDSYTAFNTNLVYRWIPSEKLQGSYERIERGTAVQAGEGYVLKRASDGTMPSLEQYGEITSASYEVALGSGWNLIANPYKGNVSLADVQVLHGSNSPVTWLEAAAAHLLVDGIYYYLGEDWGGENAFESAAGSKSAVLTPWIGYWIYVNPTDQPIRLLIPRPRQ